MLVLTKPNCRNGRDPCGAHRDDKKPIVRGVGGCHSLRARPVRYGAGGGVRRHGAEHLQTAPESSARG